jgi:hypothetical protein
MVLVISAWAEDGQDVSFVELCSSYTLSRTRLTNLNIYKVQIESLAAKGS